MIRQEFVTVITVCFLELGISSDTRSIILPLSYQIITSVTMTIENSPKIPFLLFHQIKFLCKYFTVIRFGILYVISSIICTDTAFKPPEEPFSREEITLVVASLTPFLKILPSCFVKFINFTGKQAINKMMLP